MAEIVAGDAEALRGLSLLICAGWFGYDFELLLALPGDILTGVGRG